MYRLKCGTTVIKLLKLNRTPEAKPAAGGIIGDPDGNTVEFLQNTSAK
jgi:hypothetical protein